MTTDTPRTDACPHCGAKFAPRQLNYYCGTAHPYYLVTAHQSELCTERAKSQKLEAEVERLKAINADMRNFLARAIHNEGFNEEKALKFIYQ